MNNIFTYAFQPRESLMSSDTTVLTTQLLKVITFYTSLIIFSLSFILYGKIKGPSFRYISTSKEYLQQINIYYSVWETSFDSREIQSTDYLRYKSGPKT